MELNEDNCGWKKGSMPFMLLTVSVDMIAFVVCDDDTNNVLNDDGNGTTPLMLLTCKSEMLAIIE